MFRSPIVEFLSFSSYKLIVWVICLDTTTKVFVFYAHKFI